MAKYADANGLSHAFTVIKNALSGKADSSHTHNGLVPSGGTAGQVLSKSSATDYDMAWATLSNGADTLIEDVEIAIPSTTSGSNASGKSAYTQTPGYSPIGVVGYDWKSGGTRNNFFNFYKMDVSTANKQVIVSACNLHGSSAASGTVIVKTLMKRSDLI